MKMTRLEQLIHRLKSTEFAIENCNRTGSYFMSSLWYLNKLAIQDKITHMTTKEAFTIVEHI